MPHSVYAALAPDAFAAPLAAIRSTAEDTGSRNDFSAIMVAAFRQHRVSRAQTVVAVPLPAQSACTTVRTVYYREYTRPNRCSL